VAAGLLDPIGILGAPDGTLLVNERAGRVLALDPESGETTTFLDLRDRVLGGGEQGLLGLALDPAWPEEPRAFVHYTGLDGNPVLAEFRVSDLSGPPRLDPSTERQLLTLDDPYGNHNGGQLAFGPDGYLWMSLGDGGAGGDPFDNGQNPSVLLGKILRLDVTVPDDAPTPDSMPYGIPPDNPFADGAGGAPEVFLYGLRNPWRFSFDTATGLLWIGDVGQNAFEEIDRIDPTTQAGANLGWDILEATHCYEAAACDATGMVPPVAEYGRDFGCSVTGGYVYRGEVIPDLRGWYVYSDYCSGNIFALRSDVAGTETAPRILLETDANASSFGVGADGELYLADIGSGTIYRIVAGG
jgi:glucose/arabinose dehydrogenase